MPFIPAENTIETVLQHSYAGQDMFNVLNFLYPGPPGIPDLHIVITALGNAWNTFIAPMMVAGVRLEAIRATDLTTSTGPSILEPFGGSNIGGVTGPGTSNNVALVLSEGTDLRGRSYRGRLYMGGMPSDQRLTSSIMSSTYVDNFIDGWSAFFDDVHDNADTTHVIVSRYTGGVARAAAVMTEVTSYSANDELDSMRSRLAGRGT